MADVKIEMRVSGPDAEETVRAILDGAPDGAEVIVDQAPVFQAGPALRQAVLDARDLPGAFAEWWSAAGADGGFGPVSALLIAAVVLLAVYGAERAAAGWLTPSADGRGAFFAMWRRALAMIVRIVLFVVVAGEVIGALAGEGTAAAAIGAALLAAVLQARINIALTDVICAPGAPERRLTALSDDGAATIMRWVTRLSIAVATLAFLRMMVVDVAQAGEAGKAFAVATRVAAGALAIIFFVLVRAPVAGMFHAAFAREAAPTALSARFFSRWHLFYALLMVLTVLSDTYGYLFPAEAGVGAASSYSFMVFVLTPFALAGIGLWRRTVLAVTAEERRGMVIGGFALLEGATILIASLLLLRAWDIDPFSPDAGRLLPALVSAALVVVFGISAWRTIDALLGIYAPKKKAEAGDDAIPDGEGGVGGSRLETIYPILRMTLSIVIGTMTILLALAALGVDIAPLIAGAGVFGLAVGFGAQTLVKDIISGMFYLYEDAFRVGEFIETDEGKGAVEKILLRSVRLRHPRGAIYTVPFGTMGTIKNHSRDWVTTKFSFDVAPTEDLERIRKLVKKVGVKLAADPELEGKFIEPLKSQGAVAMSASNYSVGVKFTCAPGEQFLIRRKAYAALQDMFEENNIKLATPRVVVNSPAEAAAAAASMAAATPPAGG